jgi:hypothetical protein
MTWGSRSRDLSPPRRQMRHHPNRVPRMERRSQRRTGNDRVRVEPTATEARQLVDNALANGKITPPPEVTPGTFFEQVSAKLKRMGLSVVVGRGDPHRAELP